MESKIIGVREAFSTQPAAWYIDRTEWASDTSIEYFVENLVPVSEDKKVSFIEAYNKGGKLLHRFLKSAVHISYE